MTNITTLIDQVSIEGGQLQLSSNFDILKQELEKYLENYKNIVVTYETYKEGKQCVTELNKMVKSIETKRRDCLAPYKEQIKFVENQAKSLIDSCKEVQSNIKSQNKHFEEIKLQLLQDLIDNYIEDLKSKFSIGENYLIVDIEDLLKVSNLEPTDDIKYKIKQEIKERFFNSLETQKICYDRIKYLKNISQENNLIIKLTEEDIKSFVLEDKHVYNQKLQTLIDKKKQEQERVKEAVKRDVIKEVKAKPSPPSMAILDKAPDPVQDNILKIIEFHFKDHPRLDIAIKDVKRFFNS
jgi:hypothetical protein